MKKLILLACLLPLPIAAEDKIHEVAVEVPNNPNAMKIFRVKEKSKPSDEYGIQVVRNKKYSVLHVYARFKGHGACVARIEKIGEFHCFMKKVRMEYRGTIND